MAMDQPPFVVEPPVDVRHTDRHRLRSIAVNRRFAQYSRPTV